MNQGKCVNEIEVTGVQLDHVHPVGWAAAIVVVDKLRSEGMYVAGTMAVVAQWSTNCSGK